MATAGRQYGKQSADERRAARRARMLEAGLDAFGGPQGFRGTTIEALCTAAGVSTRNLYEEFGSREALLVALHDELNERATAAVVTALAAVDPLDLHARAHAACSAYLEVMTSDRRWARVALVETVGVSPEAEAARQAAIDRFVALIELEAARLVEAGLLPDRDHHLTAVALAGALLGLVNTWRTDTAWDARVPAVADEAARLIVLALTAP
ncbi:TetR/AcrR family transcriptional regulator [Paraconexibacter algicola]|uniref:TetR/AcrR family transcriptional regulator n=1 Tax=Paraconexibacter algicola TaxID=2133960 RepID=A0A2T4UL38_9ACTN|nr:TetR/AcrR family transcriptional regulator [Paraconexibacter algicola]PTL59925.1 TetR/AcrR family transcriptional regulator [Paraconexibacter algicola]